MLSPRHRKVLLSVAEAAMRRRTARGRRPPDGGGLRALDRHLPRPRGARPARRLPRARGLPTIPTRGRPFSSLPIEARAEVLAGMEQSRLYSVRALLRALLTPLKQAPLRPALDVRPRRLPLRAPRGARTKSPAGSPRSPTAPSSRRTRTPRLRGRRDRHGRRRGGRGVRAGVARPRSAPARGGRLPSPRELPREPGPGARALLP